MYRSQSQSWSCHRHCFRHFHPRIPKQKSKRLGVRSSEQEQSFPALSRVRRYQHSANQKHPGQRAKQQACPLKMRSCARSLAAAKLSRGLGIVAPDTENFSELPAVRLSVLGDAEQVMMLTRLCTRVRIALETWMHSSHRVERGCCAYAHSCRRGTGGQCEARRTASA